VGRLREWFSGFLVDREGPRWAAMTYNYLRLGMFVAVAALLYSILQEYFQPGVHCFLGSVSGYYYTPVRPIFVGLMLLIGFALIVIKGRTAAEDACLTLAGIMAPVVAFIPTDDDKTGVCREEMLRIRHYQPFVDDGFVPASINNNLHTFIYAGFTAVALVLIAFVIQRRAARRNPDVISVPKGEWINLWVGLGLAILGVILVRWHYDWVKDTHALAALAMFGFLALAAIVNCVLGIKRAKTTKDKWYARTYGIVGGSMLFFGGLFVVYRQIFAWSFLGEHVVLYIEAVEIFLFVVFWVIQTVQRWNATVGPTVTTATAAESAEAAEAA
jgi:hypothetical protein